MPELHSKLGAAGSAREGNYIANVGNACDEHQHAFEAQAETGLAPTSNDGLVFRGRLPAGLCLRCRAGNPRTETLCAALDAGGRSFRTKLMKMPGM